MINREIKYPLFMCLRSETQAKIAILQWNTYGQKLDIPLTPEEPKPVIIDAPNYQEEQAIELDKIMRQAPEGQRFAK